MITAILMDKNGFKKKIKIARPELILDLPDFKEVSIGTKKDLMRDISRDKRWRFYRKEQLGKYTFLYKQDLS